MADLLHVLPDFDTSKFQHLLPSLDKALVSTTDLVTLAPAHVAKRAQVPAGELRKLVDALVPALHRHLGFGAEEPRSTAFLAASGHASAALAISTLDDELDQALLGGIRPGYLVEVTGESGAGKTQLLLTLLLAAQLPAPRGLRWPISAPTQSQLRRKTESCCRRIPWRSTISNAGSQAGAISARTRRIH
ncbi:uncharacterized protein CC84DRAFT_211060 [Paraphaeosphaeria sporulosa]|uniref:RecA family profile 1 domain-containing protein n=1 Tax=Paraphaeosphaeria sporulosa TaxID=1460663 RepID=A0A177C3E0_9PLEO|nr:uncharacterized protein CC84DRAFT_211060 [Paraphaeosphaeria sporulosa]OAG01681.1 hypothetical protein CC84DRAFT_211060 [Paraphaeosphaeria sporulosa]